MKPAVFALLLLMVCSVFAQQERNRRQDSSGYASNAPLRFVMQHRPHKMIVLGGSIAAYTDHPFARNLHEWCSALEVRNISQAGLGAHALSKRFNETFRGHNLRGQQNLWLLWNGGLNSVSAHAKTNATIAALFDTAHAAGLKVIGVSLTPWGSPSAARWRGHRGLQLADATRRVVDFVSRDSSADIKINLYDDPDLRDTQAATIPLDDAKRILSRDPIWRRSVRTLDPQAKESALVAAATRLQALPTHWLKKELQGFDYIHPNRDGHVIMARKICLELPASFQCQCQ